MIDNKKSLILTGWSIDYACAAAVALRAIPGSELMALSKRRLPDFLDELADSSSLPGQVVFIGISFLQDVDRAAAALRRITNAGTKAVQLSRLASLPEITRKFGPFVHLCCDAQAKSLTALVAAQLDVGKVDALPFIRLAETSTAPLSDADGLRAALLEATNWLHRIGEDTGQYVKAIRTIAAGKELTRTQQQVCRRYERFKHLEMRGNSRAVEELWELVRAVGTDGECPVLITGETGTGKEVIASLVHLSSPRLDAHFEAINCATLTPQLLRSELFGHRRGAFTGADNDYRGAFERAHGGTLFLDEIGDMPADVQAALLRVLQHKSFVPLGSEKEINVDIRVVAATHCDLWQMAADNEFRSDLLYRLNVIEMYIPPLRERLEDIPVIANSYLIDRKQSRLTPGQAKQLMAYDWPGNVRELLNILDRARILGTRDYAELLAVASQRRTVAVAAGPPSEVLDDVICAHAARIYAKYGRNKTQASKALGISINTLVKYLGGRA